MKKHYSKDVLKHNENSLNRLAAFGVSLCLMFFALLGCKKEKVDVAVAGIALDKTTLSVNVWASATLVATVSPSNATNKNVTWSSSVPAIATVDASGRVTAVAIGEATITATSAADVTKTASCKVTASPAPVESVSLNKTEVALMVGDIETLTAKVLPASAANKNVTWSSSADAIATVDASGKVTAVAAGEATITATSAADVTKTASCKITVNNRAFTAAGLESGAIPDSAITASSSFGGYPATRGRLNNSPWNYWGSGSAVMPQWWQVDLGRRKWVGKVAVQCAAEHDSYIITYKLQYSDDGRNWKDYNESEVIQGPGRRTSDISYKDLAPFKARYIKFVILSTKDLAIGKFEVYVAD